MSNQTDLKALKIKRSSIKGRLTKFKNYLNKVNSLEALTSIQLTELKLKTSNIESLSCQFDELQGQIESLDPESLDEMLEERDAIEQEFIISMATAQELISKCSSNTFHDATMLSNNSHCHHETQDLGFKLPQIQISKFTGAYHRWIEFRDTFTSLIHNNDRIQPVHKFHYLNSYLEGDAARVISNLEVSDSNYSKAWDLLCERYDDKRKLINNHLNSLFEIESLTRESDNALRFIIDHVNKNLRALSSLDVPTENWDVLIVHMVASKLDNQTYLKWEEHRNSLGDMVTLVQFNKFLSDRANILETYNRNKNEKHKRSSFPSGYSAATQNSRPPAKSFSCTTDALVSSDSAQLVCSMCRSNHRIYDCPKFLALSVDQRIEWASKAKICKNCLRVGHSVKSCQYGSCRECNKRHNTLLHKAIRTSAHSVSNKATTITTESTELVNNFSTGQSADLVYLSTAVIEVCNPHTGQTKTARILLDNGSQSSFMTQGLKVKLGLESLPTEPIKIIGIGNTACNLVKERCVVQLMSKHSEFKVQSTCSILPELTGTIPKVFVNRAKFNLPSEIKLADPNFNCPGPIEMIIGADLFWDIVGSSRKSLGQDRPTLVNSQFGWIVSGPISLNGEIIQNYKSNVSHCNLSSNLESSNNIEKQIAKFWELEEISKLKPLSDSERACEQHFLKNTVRLTTGCYCVRLPLNQSPYNLGDSYNLAKCRFLNLEKRFRKHPQLKEQYSNFINEYLELGHCSEFSTVTSEPNYYLPHHAVFRDNSESTKIRVVFDGSAPTTSGLSVNEIQMVGPTVQDSLLSILLRFRQHKYVLTGDIEKMYRQIVVHEDDRNLQLILWRKDESLPLKTLRLNTVTYGFASASYLSTKCLWQLGENCSDDEIKTIIQHDMYCDDLLTGANNERHLLHILNSVSAQLNSGCFHLRKFKSNIPSIFQLSNLDFQDNLSLSDSASALGLGWNPKNDNLYYSIDLSDLRTRPQLITKRYILSTTFKIFDPLGLLSPCTVQPKMTMQKLWKQNIGWDEPVPKEIEQEWKKFQGQLKYLLTLEIPRLVMCDSPVTIELHSFCDASILAYGCCIYLRSIDAQGNVTVKLLCAKSKLVPIRPVTIPRLELCGALLAARLSKCVIECLRCTIDHCYHWCDSTVVLSWLNTSPSKLKAFVANRVVEICETTKLSSWRHVPTDLNPADIISRGVDPRQLHEKLFWFSGPSFLMKSECEWPVMKCKLDEDLTELKANTVVTTIENLIEFTRFSNFIKLKRTFAYPSLHP